MFKIQEPRRSQGGWGIVARDGSVVLRWAAGTDDVGFSTDSDESRQTAVLKLADTDGNLAILHSNGAPVFGSAAGRAWLLYELPLDRRVLRVLAGGQLAAQRFEFQGGRAVTTNLDGGSARFEDLRKAAACAYEVLVD